MVRSYLLVSLVPAGPSDDPTGTRPVARAIIVEERVERHNMPADLLTHVVQVNGTRSRGCR